jgi:hypothetical protein
MKNTEEKLSVILFMFDYEGSIKPRNGGTDKLWKQKCPHLVSVCGNIAGKAVLFSQEPEQAGSCVCSKRLQLPFHWQQSGCCPVAESSTVKVCISNNGIFYLHDCFDWKLTHGFSTLQNKYSINVGRFNISNWFFHSKEVRNLCGLVRACVLRWDEYECNLALFSRVQNSFIT